VGAGENAELAGLVEELGGIDAECEFVLERSRGFGRGDAANFCVGGESGGHDGFVFFAFDGAGGVDEASGGAEIFERHGEKRRLQGLERGEPIGREAPADFRMARESAGAGAGSVDEDAIEILCEGERLRGVQLDHVNVFFAEAGEVIQSGPEAVRVEIGGNDDAVWGCGAGEDRGFSAGSAAEIENFLAGLDGDEERDGL
jgi:hypothetical protein